MLVMEHELFRHLELEAFVTDEHVVPAARFVELILRHADGQQVTLPAEVEDALQDAQLTEDYSQLHAAFTHHYPICFRRILRDDTLISMASGDAECWYSISFITYREPRDDFYQLATFLAKSMLALYGARMHWGKWFPLTADAIEPTYPELERFRTICQEFDPRGVFRNDFTNVVLGHTVPH